jgi:uncharacterized protein YjbI with pentapeptide repeats
VSDPEHVVLVKSGVNNWNQWRQDNPFVLPDLSRAELKGSDLNEADLHGADLSRAELQWSNLMSADLHGANLAHARLMGADASRAKFNNSNLDDATINDARAWYADFRDCKMRNAYLWGTDFREANFSGADLTGANLQNAQLVMTKFCGTTLDNAKVYGIAAWDIDLKPKSQSNLLISAPNDPNLVTVDDLEVAQFIYLILNNNRLRRVIDTITSKVVLILGRFTPERKAVLDALRDELRKRDYLPVLFDFDKPESRDITETVSLLARMARFVVADITEARSIPQELMAIAPDLPSVPIQPLLQKGSWEYGMFEHFRRYPWVLEEHVYASSEDLIADLGQRVIAPAEVKVRELRGAAR